MKLSIIEEKSKGFAIRVVKLYKYLTGTADEREYVLSKQLLRSGTSIGANVKEALRGQSRADFHSKMNIALKEACETEYWIELLKETDYISEEQFLSLQEDYKEIIKILMSITKSTSPMTEDKFNCEL
ncbi:MAG: four helix bundle protein [Prevotella sp.]|nr:four helix bundle protein [Prevotella sp.]